MSTPAVLLLSIALLAALCLPSPVRSLHVYGTSDRMVAEERSLAFLAAFETASPGLTERFVHPGGHFVPTCTGLFRDALRDFVDRAMVVRSDDEVS